MMEHILNFMGWLLIIVAFYNIADMILGFFLKYSAQRDGLLVGGLLVSGLFLVYNPKFYTMAIVLSILVLTILIRMNTLSRKLYLKK